MITQLLLLFTVIISIILLFFTDDQDKHYFVPILYLEILLLMGFVNYIRNYHRDTLIMPAFVLCILIGLLIARQVATPHTSHWIMIGINIALFITVIIVFAKSSTNYSINFHGNHAPVMARFSYVDEDDDENDDEDDDEDHIEYVRTKSQEQEFQQGWACPICMETGFELEKGQKLTDLTEDERQNVIVWLKPCGHPTHLKCAKEWFKTQRQRGQPLTCPRCRQVRKGISLHPINRFGFSKS